jgi:two-component system invasion response regulator UvrY
MIKIGLVDDHVVLRKSLAVLIRLFKHFKIVLEASNGEELISQLSGIPKKNHPDILLLDITMPVMDGPATAEWLQRHYPHIKLIALTMIRNDFMVLRMLKNGIRAYLLKDCDPEMLQTALEEVHYNDYFYNDIMTEKMAVGDPFAWQQKLTAQEISFLRWACTEMTHKQIADEMKVSPRTVDGYRDALLRKLNLTSRVGIALYAIKSGFVQL